MNRSCSRALRTTLCFAGTVLAGGAAAQIVDCQPPPSGYSVFLSEPAFTPAAFPGRQEMRAFLDRLQFELDQGQDARWVHAPAVEVRFVVCANRSPALDGRDFDATLVDKLHTRRVLLEIWGSLDVVKPADKPSGMRAQINYMLVPIQFAAHRNEGGPGGLQRLEYIDAAGPGDFVQLIARPRDIDAFVAAALGFKLLRERSREPAYGNLCRAGALLEQMLGRETRPGTKKNLQMLRAFVLDSAGRAVKEAQSDAKYSPIGILRLQDPARPCAREEG
jgi:hypothetical protein